MLRLTAHQPFPVQAGRYKQVPGDWHHEGTEENPFNAHQRVVTAGEAKGIYSLREDSARLNHFHVQDVRAVTRGGGRAAMEHLTRMADRHQVSLQLVAEPLRPQGDGVKMTRSKLRAWYHSHGFRPRQGDLMVRTPTKLEKSMSPFREISEQLEKSWLSTIASKIGGKKPAAAAPGHDIRTIRNSKAANGVQDLVVRMTHKDTGAIMDTHLSRDHDQAPWSVVNSYHVKGNAAGKATMGNFTKPGDMGTSGVRQLAGYLRATHGVKNVFTGTKARQTAV